MDAADLLPIRIAYFVHDLADAAVDRRVRMLQSAGSLVLIGFRRRGAPSTELRGRPVVEVGRTADASFVQRLFAVARAWLLAPRWRKALAGADLILARQLEMLALAVLTRPSGTPIVYECLDIHRLMLGDGLASRTLRRVEGALLRRCSGLIVSSPAFLTAHFVPRYAHAVPPSQLLENKVLQADLSATMWPWPAGARGTIPARAPPWRIGWFGIIRCRRSLLILIDLLRRRPGQVELVIRGRPSRTAIADFDTLIEGVPGLRFEGPYDRATDLAAIYGDVHFVWAIDFFEYPGNSEWLLPNRLYEGSVFGSVPIALRSVETGRWLARHGAGILVPDDVPEGLQALFDSLTMESYLGARAKVAEINRQDIVDDDESCRGIVVTLGGRATIGRSDPGLQSTIEP